MESQISKKYCSPILFPGWLANVVYLLKLVRFLGII